MSFNVLYSRNFLTTVHSWAQTLEKMAFQAAEHTALDPDLNDYKRQNIAPYRQKHPTSNHQYTLYFQVISTNEIFIVWINDITCLHDTRANYSDPCLKEFNRLKSRGELEIYDPAIHRFSFEIHPDSTKPFRCRSSFLNYEVTLSSGLISGIFIGHAFSCSDPDFKIAKKHVSMFLEALHDCLLKNRINLQLQFTKVGHSREIDLILASYDSKKWIIEDEPEDFILKKI